jgi:hypothetical protein
MRYLAIITLIALIGSLGSARAENVTLTTAQVIELAVGLNALDEKYDKVIKDGSTEKVAKVGYQLSAVARLAVANDMVQVRNAQQAYQDAVQKIRAQYMTDGGLKASADGKSLEGPKIEEYTAQVRQMLDAKQELPLQKIKDADLRLDENPIPSSVLAALQPIRDDK